MRKFCFSFFLALFVCAGSCFALSPDDSLDCPPVSSSLDTVGAYMLDAVSSLSASASVGWTDTDHEWLNQIRLTLTQSKTGSILGYLQSLDITSDNIYNKLFSIKQSTDYLQNINNNGNSVVSLLRSDLKGSDILSVLNNAHLDRLAKESTLADGLFDSNGYSRLSRLADNNEWLHPRLRNWLAFDGYDQDYTDNPTLYHYVKNLSETLASDDDKALADAQKPNRDQIKQDFVSGSSGKTSLGAADFGDLSSVGGSVKDSLSLNGQSSISGFTGGLSDSDEAGQGWFSANTRDALDSVSSSSSYGLKREKGNSDIYNMAGFSDHYSWLYGD